MNLTEPDIQDVVPVPRPRKRARRNTDAAMSIPVSDADHTTNSVSCAEAPVNALQGAMPSADDIASALITQLTQKGLLPSSGTNTLHTNVSENSASNVVSIGSVLSQCINSAPAMQQNPVANLPSSDNDIARPAVGNTSQLITVQNLSAPSNPSTVLEKDSNVSAIRPQSATDSVTQPGSQLDSLSLFPAEIPGTNTVSNPAFSYVKHSLPLGYNVSDKTKNLIMSNQYVDFAALIPGITPSLDNENVLFQSPASSIKISTTSKINTKRSELTNIHQWMNAFDIFHTIYTDKYPLESKILTKYGNNIRFISQEFGFNAAKFYDEQFRLLRVSFQLNWAEVHDELWRRASLMKRGSTSGTSTMSNISNTQRNQPFLKGYRQDSKRYPKGFCFQYCANGSCANKTCVHKHFCFKCGQKHASDTCTGQSQKPKQAKPANPSQS